jgi:hypothetical protein
MRSETVQAHAAPICGTNTGKEKGEC